MSAVITGAGTALPAVARQDELWDGFFARHFNHRRSAKIAFESAGILTRHAVLNPMVEDVSLWSTGARMERYNTEAVPLAVRAAREALGSSNVSPDQIGLLVVASCTGYATPGVDVRLAHDLEMSSSLQRLIVGHVGCHAALPALEAVNDYVVARHKPALLLCIELSSLHVQPATTDLGQAVVHSLFSDAATAVVVEPSDELGRPGVEVVDLIAHTDSSSADQMTWNVTDLGFRMTLSRRVPDTVAREIKPLVTTLLRRNAISKEMVDGWAIHPGGPRVLDAIADRLCLDARDLAASRLVLSQDGNCSSATALLVLDQVRKEIGISRGKNIVVLAFGPGLTLYAALLRTV